MTSLLQQHGQQRAVAGSSRHRRSPAPLVSPQRSSGVKAPSQPAAAAAPPRQLHRRLRLCASAVSAAQNGGPAPAPTDVDEPACGMNPYDDIEYVLFSEQAIHQRVDDIGKQLAQEYARKSPLVLGVLTGAFQFTGDLVRAIQPPPRGIQVNFVRASSYGSGTASSGEVKLKVDLAPEVVEGRHVLLVEDIVDTGLTLTRLRRYMLEECKAASCCIVTLLDKKERRKVPLVPDYTGFDCPNEFVVGYGLDYDEEHRTLPFIGVLKPHCYAHKS